MPTPVQKMTDLLQQLVEGQEKQNHLLKFVANTLSAKHRDRAAALNRWKSANPVLSAACREAAETWAKVHNAALTDLTDEIVHQSEQLRESDFARQELIDRHGPRMHHLNALSMIFQQLGGPAAPSEATPDNRRPSSPQISHFLLFPACLHHEHETTSHQTRVCPLPSRGL